MYKHWLVLWPAIIFGMAFGLGNIVRDCSLTCNVGYQLAPIAIVVIALVATPIAALQTRYEQRWGYLRWQTITTLLLSLSIFGFWFAMYYLFSQIDVTKIKWQNSIADHGTLRWVYLGFYTWLGATIGLAAYNSSQSIFLLYPAHERNSPLLYNTLCKTVAAIFGSWLAGQLFFLMNKQWGMRYETSRDALLILMGFVILLNIPIAYLTHKFMQRQQAQSPNKPTTPAKYPLREVLHWLLFDRKIRSITVVFLLGGMIFSVGIYIFFWMIHENTKPQGGRTLFFADFYIWLNAISLLMLSFGTRKLVQKIGLVLALLVLPVVLLSGSAMLFAMTTLTIIYFLRVIDGALFSSLHFPGLQWLLLQIDERRSAVVRGLMNGVVSRIGEGLGAAVILVATFGFQVSLWQTIFLYIVTIAAWAFSIFRLRYHVTQ